MVPYIAALIILIVAILFAVYKRVDTFEIVMTTLKPTDTLQTAITINQGLLKRNSAILNMLESSTEIEEELTQAKLNELGLPYSMVEGKVKVTGKNVSTAMIDMSKMLDKEVQSLVDAITKLNPSMKLNELISNPQELNGFLAAVDMLKGILLARERYLKSKLGSTTVGGVNTEDLYDAVSGSDAAVKASTVEDTTARSTDVDVTTSKEKKDCRKGTAPTQTPAATKEMEDRIAKSIVTQIKDTLLSKRSTSNGMEEANCPYAAYDSNSTAQGREYSQVKPIQPAPDMSEYIRKDSIPCWNCTLP
jgi:hypothetical protein